MVCLGILMLIFDIVAIIAIVKHREYLFQVRSRLLICGLYGALLFIVSLHYALSLDSNLSIFFVIIQEFLKISVFWYVVFFYIKNAFDFSVENSRHFVKILKISMIAFLILFGLALVFWMIFRWTKVIIISPWKDDVWMIYRIITLILIVWIILSGVIVQQKVLKKADALIQEASSPKIDFDEFQSLNMKDSSSYDAGKYYITSSVIRRKHAIVDSLK